MHVASKVRVCVNVYLFMFSSGISVKDGAGKFCLFIPLSPFVHIVQNP